MRYLLDSNAVIAIMKEHPKLLMRMQQHAPEDFAISTINAHELHYGAYKSQQTESNLGRVEALRFEVLDFDRHAAEHAAVIRVSLEKRGAPIGPYDCQIAGHARSRDLTLISRNTREFERVPELKLEDWEA
ncbi:MAG: type II toxin-antitoxin system VapC family toxin [Hyphomicrobiaceae bacterium]|nr:type II toxin-antitoxin system VapC family toxin [Hyphomicrobiaceae bacterium]